MHATLYSGCKVATLSKARGAYGLIENGAVAVCDGRIAWAGDAKAVPTAYADYYSKDLGGRLMTPALIDCHTHLIFGGTRAHEFEMRLNGVAYEEISRQGGGINSTVQATRVSSDEALLQSAKRRANDLIREGVGVIEVKSGYGLTIDDELRMLRVARKLETVCSAKIVTTWLAAHAVPPEFNKRPDDYIDEVVIPGLEIAAAEGLVDAVDGFCENIGFTLDQTERVFLAAKALGLPVKLHAEQLTDQKGALLAARYQAMSADHLEYLAPEDVETFGASGTVAVLLPGAYYTLRETKLPPIELLRRHNVDMAIATDCNPGSSPLSSILVAMNMACTEFLMTPEEALAGVTRSAAKALNLGNDYGTIAPGLKADFAVWNVDHPAELAYWIGGSPLYQRISQ